MIGCLLVELLATKYESPDVQKHAITDIFCKIHL